MPELSFVVPALFAACVLFSLVACARNHSEFTIPNSVALVVLLGALIAIGFEASVSTEIGWLGPPWVHFASFGITFVVGVVFYLKAWLGAGSIKQMMAFSLWAPSLLFLPLCVVLHLVYLILIMVTNKLRKQKSSPYISYGVPTTLISFGSIGYFWIDQLMALVDSF